MKNRNAADQDIPPDYRAGLRSPPSDEASAHRVLPGVRYRGRLNPRSMQPTWPDCSLPCARAAWAAPTEYSSSRKATLQPGVLPCMGSSSGGRRSAVPGACVTYGRTCSAIADSSAPRFSSVGRVPCSRASLGQNASSAASTFGLPAK